AGESQANRKYTAFSRKAEADGFAQVARLFRAAAESETVHALNHLRVMKGVGTTLENLKAALEGETYEHTRMYPDFIKTSESENRSDARLTFHYASEAEKGHSRFYQDGIEAVKSGKDLPPVEYFVCQACGYTADKEAPEKCPVCGALKNQFKRIT
ncbi:rubrerythrin family protein, partial [Candidatus Bathyarchaeota archaeon]|nr:rubrerythrin family protein [Candidatus Bathyarchaeota archaeon]